MGLSKDPKKRARQLANLKVFQKGVVTNPNGRPRTTIHTIFDYADKQGIKAPTAGEISRLYVCIASMTESELNDILKDNEQPMMVRIIARGILDKKGLDVLEKIIDRAYGKEHRIDITTNGKDLKPEPLTIRFVADKEALASIQSEVPAIE